MALPRQKPQPTFVLEVSPGTEVEVGKAVAIVAKLEPLEKLDLKWSVSGTAGGTLNTDTGEQVVYTAGKEGTDIVVAEGNTASGVPVKQTLNLTVVGETKCQITEPADGDENLGFENEVKVTCSDVPTSLYVWVLVYSHYDSNFYPKPGPIGSGSGNYVGTAYLGIEGPGKGRGIGDRYGIIVALADEVVNKKLRKDAASFSGYELKLPDGVEEKARITVMRGH